MVATTLDGNWDIPIGAPVHTADGQRLGYVVAGDARGILVGEGFLFTHEHTVQLADVERYEDGVLVLKLTRDQMMER